MKVAFFGKSYDNNYDAFMKAVIHKLSDNGVKIIVYKQFWDDLSHCFDNSIDSQLFNSHEQLKDNADMLFSFGGDGTILDTLPLIRESNIPVIGINTGHLGFLSSVSEEEALDAVQNIIENKYDIEPRTMIQIEDENRIFDGVNYALNEISIMRENSGSLIIINVYIDGILLNTYWADGLILATPTGSTAYSMSVGGPIMTPNTDSILITPIAAHNLSVRPVVIPDTSNVTIKVEGRCENFVLGLDSRTKLLNKSIQIKIKKTNFSFNMVKMYEKNFFTTLRHKLLWGNDVRN